MQSLLCLLFASLLVGCFANKDVFDYRAWTHWEGICAEGKQQSPINIDLRDTQPSLPGSRKAKLNSFGTVSSYTVYFTGTNLKIDFKPEDFVKKPFLFIVANEYTKGNSTGKGAKLLKVIPKEFHFHTSSEHSYNGYYAPGELQIVTEVAEGWSKYCDKYGPCYAIFAVMLTYYGEATKGRKIFDALIRDPPIKTGRKNGYVVDEKLNLDLLVPFSRGHYLYLGSLTVPPCTEKVTWHIFKESVSVSKYFIESHQELTSLTWGPECMWKTYGYCFPPREKTNNRRLQLYHGRVVTDVVYYDQSEASSENAHGVVET